MTRRHSFINLELTTYTSPHVWGSGFQNQRNFVCGIRNQGKSLIVESGILGFGIRNTAQGIRNITNDCNPESKVYLFHWHDKNWNPVPGIQNPRRWVQNPRLSWIALHCTILFPLFDLNSSLRILLSILFVPSDLCFVLDLLSVFHSLFFPF